MREKKEENRLRHNDSDKSDTESLLTQWQTCIEMADSVSARRDTMNNLFVTLHLALITTVAVIWDSKAYPLLGLGCVLCLLWLISIGNYRKLNQAKYDVICEIEKQLPT
ncbi:MAG: RipA family octameric membrane protein, partial [Anaerolineaceae bacterium]